MNKALRRAQEWCRSDVMPRPGPDNGEWGEGEEGMYYVHAFVYIIIIGDKPKATTV